MTKEELAANWTLNIIPDVLSPDRRTDLTLVGAYVLYYENSVQHWEKESTRAQNNAYLNNVIVPALEGHNEKTIDEYTMDDFEEAIERIREMGQLRARKKGKFQPYKDATLQKFRNIIARTIQAASQYGLCEDIFKESYFLLDQGDIETSAEEVLLVKKSIPLPTEISLIEDLLSDYTIDGETVGFLLVIACGLRLNESAAANYRNICEMKFYPGNYKLMVYESVVLNSNTVKTSGKSPNADRVIPLYARVSEFLLRRKEYIAADLKRQGLDIDVDTLPIACVGRDYSQRCTTKQIADAAREIFIRHGVKPKVFQHVDLSLRGSSLCEIREKNPTAYLGRHIFATQLAILDLDKDEIQAIIGHEIENPGVTRNDFNSDEKLYRIKQKMDRMPIYRLSEKEIEVSEGEDCISGTGPLSLQTDVPLSFLHITADAEEPTDAMTITCSPGTDGMLITGKKETEFRQGIDIMQMYEEIYAMIKGTIQ